jgi:3-hydroxyethyl bacteriochlorophyllide a dehydrogenase
MHTVAVVLESPGSLDLRMVELTGRGADDVVIDVEWTGISSGTERLLWSGRMPEFPGLGYPLVPGYETIGHVASAPMGSAFHEGDRVFVPGANCYRDVRGLFGGAAQRLIVPASRVIALPDDMAEAGVLFALAATAYHAIASEGASLPELIIGHGLLGRLVARVALALGAPVPTVWETQPARRTIESYAVIDPALDMRRDYNTILDASGDSTLLDRLIPKLAKRGEITLAGFYEAPLSFTFPPAFMREARIRIAAEFTKSDSEAVGDLVRSGRLSLDGLITDRAAAINASLAYRKAFTDPTCIKMVLDWRQTS